MFDLTFDVDPMTQFGLMSSNVKAMGKLECVATIVDCYASHWDLNGCAEI
eukprot:COSAG02_NODE_9923_length_2074_cov_1.293165_5_plen_50_part_00